MNLGAKEKKTSCQLKALVFIDQFTSWNSEEKHLMFMRKSLSGVMDQYHSNKWMVLLSCSCNYTANPTHRPLERRSIVSSFVSKVYGNQNISSNDIEKKLSTQGSKPTKLSMDPRWWLKVLAEVQGWTSRFADVNLLPRCFFCTLEIR